MQGDSERYVYPRGNFTIYKTNTEKSYLNTYMYLISFFLFRIWDPPINPISSARTSKRQISQYAKHFCSSFHSNFTSRLLEFIRLNITIYRVSQQWCPGQDNISETPCILLLYKGRCLPNADLIQKRYRNRNRNRNGI